MWDLVKACIGTLTPIFMVLSPVLSYSDQAFSMHKKKTSAGFSLDIPLIMLVASLMRIFYWFGSRFDVSLLLQAVIMVGMQVVLLKIALDHRPPSMKGGDPALPFAGVQESTTGWQRPYNFWQWRSHKPYWQFVLYLLAGLVTCELLLSQFPSVYSFYSEAIGFIGLSVEAILPLPQILTNARAGSIKGFRLSILASWLAGDAMKMTWFFTATTPIPWPFKLCGMFQAMCDCTLGLQYLKYGSGDAVVVKEHETEMDSWPVTHHSGAQMPTRRASVPEEHMSPVLAEKEVRD